MEEREAGKIAAKMFALFLVKESNPLPENKTETSMKEWIKLATDKATPIYNELVPFFTNPNIGVTNWLPM